MKDIRFQGTDLDVTFRVDSIPSSYTGNLTVCEIRGLNDANIDRDHEVQLLTEFQKLPYTWNAFIQFAYDTGLRLSVAETDGSEEEVLVEETASESVSGSVSGIFDQ